METQKINVELPEGINRIETGNLKINDDWTGVFIRGDNSIYYSILIDRALKGNLSVFDEVALESLKTLLSGCHEHPNNINP